MTNNEVPKLQYCKIKFYKHDIFNTYKINNFYQNLNKEDNG